jgi:hypothetical protein
LQRIRLTSMLALTVIAAPLGAANPPAGDAAAWERAEQVFRDYITPHLQTARSRHGDPTIQDAEYRSELLRKHLSDFRVHVKTGPYDGTAKIFLLSKEGKIVELGEGLWIGDQTGARIREVTAFVKSRKLPVRNAAEAIEAARLTEELQGSAGYVGFLQLNTNGFRVFDSRFLSRHYGPTTDWKYSAEPRAKGWIVKREYVGPPAMVPQPPVYHIDVDDRQLFVDLVDVARAAPSV